MLFVGVAPCKHIREGSDVRSETKIFNLETHEFGSNPPLEKNVPPYSFCGVKWREQKLKKTLAGNVLLLSGRNWSFKIKSKFKNLELKKKT